MRLIEEGDSVRRPDFFGLGGEFAIFADLQIFTPVVVFTEQASAACQSERKKLISRPTTCRRVVVFRDQIALSNARFSLRALQARSRKELRPGPPGYNISRSEFRAGSIMSVLKRQHSPDIE